VFLRQVVAELRKVIWPTRHELVTYTTVALVFILVMVAIVTSLDYGFTKLIVAVFG
jgi:preprotein translocase subunit SecE